ncbi:MAG: Ig-like domain-containing protein [Mycobacterium sp.]
MGASRGYAGHVGRVGALAVALGIGSAMFVGAGTALAEESGTTSAGSGSGATAGAGNSATSGTSGSDQSSASSAPAAEPSSAESSEPSKDKTDPADEAGAGSETADDATSAPSSDATDPEPTQEPETTDDAGVTARHSGATPAPTAEQTAVARQDTGWDADDEVAVHEDAAPSDDAREPDPDPAPVAVVVDEAPASVQRTNLVVESDDSMQQAAQQVTVARAELITVDDSTSTGQPAVPYQQGTLEGLLALIAREIEYTFFNKRPTVTYDSSLTVQTDAGQVTGAVKGTDADGDALTYSVVSGPTKGVVTVAADGSFTYTPYAELAATGGTDSFLVKVSDYPGNPFHIHGLALFFGDAYQRVTVDLAATTATSPLGTQDQIDAEKLATEIANTPIMALAKWLLKMSWQASAEKLFGTIDAKNMALLDKAVNEYALQAALELQLLNPNDSHVIQQVMPPHTWFNEAFGGARILYDNPDTIYRMIPVNASSSYVITGRFTGPEPADTTFSVLTGLTGTTTGVLTAHDLVRNADGSFTITVDSTPADGRPNHLQLPSDATLIAARNTLSDWNTQVPMSLSIERVGGPPNNLFSQLGFYDFPVIGPLFSSTPILSQLLSLVPPLNPMPLWLQATETAIVSMLGLFMEPQYMAVAATDAVTGEPRPANVLSAPAHNASFLANQLQSAGHFQLADDEALVITIDPGSARYFNVPVTNVWTVTDNYWDQQTSLNNVQAVHEAGQPYTLVLSPTEPCTDAGCVANWVSTGGLNQGTLSIRFQDIDLENYVAPTVSAHWIKLADLDTELPPGTKFLTPEERAEALATRKAGYDKRYAPFVQI